VDRDERALVQQCLDGDEDACADLVQEYAPMVGTVVWRAAGDRDVVEDLAQETFLRVFRGLRYFDARSKLSTWIYTIAHRVAVDHVRQRHVRPSGLDPQERHRAPQRDPEAAAAHGELDRIVRAQLETLPEKYRLPLVYATIEELDYRTIAAMLKVKPGTVKTLVFRARQLLKAHVQSVLARREGSHAT
jgi:RNA polymerase sigma-70 factor (ECF subfamily)